jgi:spermidine synthase
MNNSLFVEQHEQGLAFYIDGDLQFDTEDEAIYHEYLAIPAIALAARRFPGCSLRVLICGGGDGLAARDVLRFPQVDHIDLVDYNPEVIEYGKTIFKPFNQGSLESEILNICERDAFDFVSDYKDKSDRLYHVIICDFTYPNRLEETRVYSQEWYQKLKDILHPGGIVSINGMSPISRTLGFWCVYKTIHSAELMAQPMQILIPSFLEHEYGSWGFFLASEQAINQAEIGSIEYPESLQFFQIDTLLDCFIFEEAIANLRHSVRIHTLESPHLFYYLLNPQISPNLSTAQDSQKTIDFLEFDPSESQAIAEPIADENLLQLESLAKQWLGQFDRLKTSADSPESLSEISSEIIQLNLAKLFPVQHRYHQPKMVEEWVNYLKYLLAEVDLKRLLSSLLERSQKLPAKVAKDLQELLEKLRSEEPIDRVSPRMAELLLLLSITLLMANLVIPDAAFAKGSSSSSGDSQGYYRVYDSQYYGGEDYTVKIIGFFISLLSGYWLCRILKNYSNSDPD